MFALYNSFSNLCYFTLFTVVGYWVHSGALYSLYACEYEQKTEFPGTTVIYIRRDRQPHLPPILAL